MKNKGESFRNFIVISLTVVLLLSIIMVPFLVEGKAFMVGRDIMNQYRLFYIEFRHLLASSIKNHVLPFWSWNLFLGNNFWVSKVYYVLTDIFEYISLFFNLHYYYLLMIQTALKICLSVLSFFIYGRIRKFKFSTNMILSLAWGFSSWAMHFVCQPTFLYFYSLVPLYFVALEVALFGRRRYLLSLMTGIMLLANYYLFYTLSLFTIVYCLYRYHETHRTFKGVFKTAVSLIAYYLVGVLCTMVVILPCLFYILDNSRVGDFAVQLKWDDLRIYMNLLLAAIYPTNIYMDRLINLNGTTTYSSIYNVNLYSSNEVCLWSSSLVALLTLNSIFDNDRVRRRANRIYICFVSALMILPVLSAVMHGFSEPSFRWMMFAIFMNLMISGYYLEDLNRISAKALKIMTVLIVLIIICDLPIASLLLHEEFSRYLDQYLKMIIIIPIIIATMVLLLRHGPRRVLMLIVVIELAFSAYMTFNDNEEMKSYDWDFIDRMETVLGNYGDFEYYVRNTLHDDSFFRVMASYDSVYWYASLNMNLIYGFPGISTFDTTYSYSVDDLLKIAEIDKAMDWSWNINQSDVLDFVSAKYALVTSENEVPFANYLYLGDYEGIMLYENLDCRSTANTYAKIISYDDYQISPDPSMINEYIICDENDFEAIANYISVNNTTVYSAVDLLVQQNSVYFYIQSDEKSFVVTSIPYDRGWNVYVDGQKINIYNVNGGFIGFALSESGEHEVNMYFVPYGIKMGALLSSLGIVVFCLLFCWEEKKIHKSKKSID